MGIKRVVTMARPMLKAATTFPLRAVAALLKRRRPIINPIIDIRYNTFTRA